MNFAKYRACDLILLFTTLLISCDSSNINNQHRAQLVVFSVLSPNLAKQTVIVDKIYSIGDTITDTTGLSGATVLIWNNEISETIHFIESDTPGFYHDTINHQWVKPLRTYHLLVTYEGDTVLAVTSVPDTFKFLRPIMGETLYTSSLPIFTWRKSEKAKAYLLFPFEANTNDSGRFILPLIVSDTFLDMNLYKDAYFDSTGFYQINNFALDENRYRYEVGPPRIDTLGEGIGHFGSQTLDKVIVYIIKD